jgi:hypothetical protein
MQSMNRILRFGIDKTSFQDSGDFGSRFYCADKVRVSLRFAILPALEGGAGRTELAHFEPP